MVAESGKKPSWCCASCAMLLSAIAMKQCDRRKGSDSLLGTLEKDLEKMEAALEKDRREGHHPEATLHPRGAVEGDAVVCLGIPGGMEHDLGSS